MTAATRLLVLINPAANRARRLWPYIKETLANRQIDFKLCETSAPHEGETSTRRALREGSTIVAVVGGDGTLSRAAAGFFEPEQTRPSRCETPFSLAPINPSSTLALIPAGTGNDFARSLSGARASLDAWLSRLADYYHNPHHDATQCVDVLHATTNGDGGHSFVCLNAATLGLGAAVAARVAAQGAPLRRLPGEARFALAALQGLANWRNRLVRVQLDDQSPFECHTNMLVVANGAYAGGGMMLAPAASPDDNQLDVVVVCDATRLQIMRELPRVFRGGHVANPQVRVMRGSQVRIEAGRVGSSKRSDRLLVEADGDVRSSTPITFCVVPRALRVVG